MIKYADLNQLMAICYVRANPNENVWEKGLVIRKVICVPDSYVMEVDGHRYHHNKRDLTLVPPSNDNDVKSESDSQQTNHNVPMARAVMPTLHPRPQLKFPKFRLSTRLCKKKKKVFLKGSVFKKKRFLMPEKRFFYCVHI